MYKYKKVLFSYRNPCFVLLFQIIKFFHFFVSIIIPIIVIFLIYYYYLLIHNQIFLHYRLFRNGKGQNSQ